MIAHWFEQGWDVRTEVPILLPGGATNRIDRLIIKGKHAIVVDFKTGEKSNADRKQVSEYMEILRKMEFVEVEGYLLYTRDKEVVSIPGGKHTRVRKKDDKQLGLDF